MCLQGGGRIDAESETFVVGTIAASGAGTQRPAGQGNELDFLVAIPLDLRNATRDPDKHDEQNRQGCGVGANGEPAPTLTKEFVPGIAHSLRAEGHDASEDGTGRGVPLGPVAWDEDISGAIVRGGDGGRHAGVMTLAIRGRGDSTDLEVRADGTANALLTPNGGRGGIGVGAVAFMQNMRGELRVSECADSLTKGGRKPGQAYQAALHGMAVRRLLPEEAEKLQGFPPGYTNIPGAADGPRYKALGNSMAVPCMAWIGRRIKEAYAND